MTNNPIKILVVDDSAVVRRAVSDALSADPELKVVGTAANGKIALRQIAHLSPEVLILDIEMPEADGFYVLFSIRRDYPELRTIMFSSLTQRGAVQTIEALSLGADDYVSKPTGTISGSYGEAIKNLASQLIPKIKQFRPQPHLAGIDLPRSVKPRASHDPPQILAIGISTGGPEALSRLLPMLPEHFPVPIVIVQHMPPVFTRLLAERMDMNARISAREGEHGMSIEAGTAYFAPGDYHMTLKSTGEKVIIHLTKDSPENSCRPSADVLFRSVAKIYKNKAMAVVMTGMGQDGMLGVRELKKHGATILAQDEKSSVVWGMPAAVIRDGSADSVVSLDQMGETINQFVATGFLAASG